MPSVSAVPGAEAFPDVRARWEEGFAGRDGRAGLITRYELEQDGDLVTLRSTTENLSAGTPGEARITRGRIVCAFPERELARLHLDDHRIVFFDLRTRRFASAERNLRMTIRFTRPEGWPPGDVAPIGALLSELHSVASHGQRLGLEPRLADDGVIQCEPVDGIALRGEYRRELGDRPVHLHAVLDGPGLPYRFDLGLTRTHHPHRLLLDGTLHAAMLRDRADELVAATERVLGELGLGPVECRVWKR